MMPEPARTCPDNTPDTSAPVSTWHILSFVYFTFIVYMSMGLPLAVLPPFVHLKMGYSAMLAGSAISIQYVATLVSRPWAGRISDQFGAKVSVVWGMAGCTASGVLLVAAALLDEIHWLSFGVLILSRLAMGVGESLGSTGSTLWGITATGNENMARVIGYNGISTYGAMAIGAPIGVVLDQTVRSKSWSRARLMGSRAPNGSSMSRTGEPMARARAMAPRCCMPPESSNGNLAAAEARPTSSSYSAASCLRHLRSVSGWALAMARVRLSSSVIHGKSE